MANDARRAERELDRRESHEDEELSTVEPTWPVGPGEHAVTELLAQTQGGLSPYGEDMRFPLPLSVLAYEPTTARPNR